MEKIAFKNKYLNIAIGVILVALAILGYILGWVEDFLPLFIGSILILISLKRFVYSYKKIVSKNATLILAIELILDIVFAGLLIYLKDHVELFIGLTIYIRGVSYLLINYIATRKVKLPQYVLNIGYVTLGAFLMFYPLDSVAFIVIAVSVLFIIVGVLFIHAGIKPFMKKRIAIEHVKKNEKEQEKIDKKQEKNEEKLEKLEMKVDKVAEDQKKKNEKTESLQKEIDQKKKVIETQKINLDDKTLQELKAIAKERNLDGVSQLNKAQLLIKLKEQLNKK